MASKSEFVDWSFAAQAGRAVAGAGPSVTSEEIAGISRDFQAFSRQAARLIREYTRMDAVDDAPSASVVSRGSWIQSNIVGIRHMLSPVAERVAEKFPSVTRLGGRKLSASAMGLQVGLLLGYIARKVLGQYDLLLASGDTTGKVYFVGPNIIAAERLHNLDASDFRLWIALHEITHRTQFESVPWLKKRVTDLMGQYLDGMSLDPDRIRKMMRRFSELAAGGPKAWKEANVLSIFLSGEQQEAVGQMQSLMSVIEGHGNFVMDGVAAQHIPTYPTLRRALHAQRDKAGFSERAFQRFIALDLKYEQYAVGQSFFNEVFALGGMDAVNLVWASGESIPTPSELHDPRAWLARLRSQPA